MPKITNLTPAQRVLLMSFIQAVPLPGEPGYLTDTQIEAVAASPDGARMFDLLLREPSSDKQDG